MRGGRDEVRAVGTAVERFRYRFAIVPSSTFSARDSTIGDFVPDSRTGVGCVADSRTVERCVADSTSSASIDIERIARDLEAMGIGRVDEVVDLDHERLSPFEALILLRPSVGDADVAALHHFHSFFAAGQAPTSSTRRPHPSLPRVVQSNLGRAPFGIVVAVKLGLALSGFTGGESIGAPSKLSAGILSALAFQLSHAAVDRARGSPAWTRCLPPLTSDSIGVGFDGHAIVNCVPPAANSAVSMFQTVRDLSVLLRPAVRDSDVDRARLAATHIFELAAFTAEVWDDCGGLDPEALAEFVASVAPEARAREVERAEERALWRDALLRE